MEPTVVASVIASTTSLVVAVVALVVNGRASNKAAEQAHANALGLFERQAAEQASARAEEAEERMRFLHLDDRRRLYAHLPALIFKLFLLRRDLQRADEEVKASDETAAMIRAADEAIDLRNKIIDLCEELWTLTEEIRLIASAPVRVAASKWTNATFDEKPNDEVDALRHDFLSKARAELGTDGAAPPAPGRPGPAPPGDRPAGPVGEMTPNY